MYTLNLTISTDNLKDVPVFIRTENVSVFMNPHSTTEVITDIGGFSVKETPEEVIKMIQDQDKQNG